MSLTSQHASGDAPSQRSSGQGDASDQRLGESGETWLRRIRRTRVRLMAGWWAHVFGRWLWPVALGGAAVLWLVRWLHGPVETGWMIGIGAGVLLVPIAMATARLLRSQITEEQAVVRLETQLDLDGRLTAAFAGVTRWPSRQGVVDDGLGWRWSRVFTPALTAIGLVLAAALLPLPDVVGKAGLAEDPIPPLAWEQMEKTLDVLEEEQLVEEEALQEWREQLQTLTERDPGEWFAHNSLEASDHLAETLERAGEEFQDGLMEASEALEGMEELGEAASEQEREQLASQLNQALDAMEKGALPMNRERMEELSEMAKQLNPENLSPEQVEAMKDRLAQCQAGMEAAMEGGEMNREAVERMKERMAQAARDGESLRSGEGSPSGENSGAGESPGEEGEPGEQASGEQRYGRGGPGDDGPADTPLTLGDHPTHLSASDPEAMNPTDRDRFLPGDAVGEGLAEHEEQDGAVRIQEGGSAAAGRGGARVRNERLLPGEQEVVRRFFSE